MKEREILHGLILKISPLVKKSRPIIQKAAEKVNLLIDTKGIDLLT